METRENYPPCPDTAKWQDEAALSPPFQIWLSGRPTLLGVASIISSWCWEGREGSTCATIAPPFMEVESRGGNPLESCTHGPSSRRCKEGQHQHKRPPGDGSRTTPDAGTSLSPPDDTRRGDIIVPTSTPSAAAATAAVCRIQLPQRQDSLPSRPVFVEIGGRRRAGKFNKKNYLRG